MGPTHGGHPIAFQDQPTFLLRLFQKQARGWCGGKRRVRPSSWSTVRSTVVPCAANVFTAAHPSIHPSIPGRFLPLRFLERRGSAGPPPLLDRGEETLRCGIDRPPGTRSGSFQSTRSISGSERDRPSGSIPVPFLWGGGAKGIPDGPGSSL